MFGYKNFVRQEYKALESLMEPKVLDRINISGQIKSCLSDFSNSISYFLDKINTGDVKNFGHSTHTKENIVYRSSNIGIHDKHGFYNAGENFLVLPRPWSGIHTSQNWNGSCMDMRLLLGLRVDQGVNNLELQELTRQLIQDLLLDLYPEIENAPKGLQIIRETKDNVQDDFRIHSRGIETFSSIEINTPEGLQMKIS